MKGEAGNFFIACQPPSQALLRPGGEDYSYPSPQGLNLNNPRSHRGVKRDKDLPANPERVEFFFVMASRLKIFLSVFALLDRMSGLAGHRKI